MLCLWVNVKVIAQFDADMDSSVKLNRILGRGVKSSIGTFGHPVTNYRMSAKSTEKPFISTPVVMAFDIIITEMLTVTHSC